MGSSSIICLRKIKSKLENIFVWIKYVWQTHSLFLLSYAFFSVFSLSSLYSSTLFFDPHSPKLLIVLKQKAHSKPLTINVKKKQEIILLGKILNKHKYKYFFTIWEIWQCNYLSKNPQSNADFIFNITVSILCFWSIANTID